MSTTPKCVSLCRLADQFVEDCAVTVLSSSTPFFHLDVAQLVVPLFELRICVPVAVVLVLGRSFIAQIYTSDPDVLSTLQRLCAILGTRKTDQTDQYQMWAGHAILMLSSCYSKKCSVEMIHYSLCTQIFTSSQLVLVRGAFQLFDGIQTVLESGLIGLGMQRAASRVKLLTMLVVRVGGAYVSRCELGPWYFFITLIFKV